VALGSPTVATITLGGHTAAALTVPFTAAPPGARVTVTVTRLVGVPVLLARGWRCQRLAGSTATATTSLACTYVGTAPSAPPLRLGLLTSGPSTATITVTGPVGTSDPDASDNTAVVTVAR
jgi:hypothetical protein